MVGHTEKIVDRSALPARLAPARQGRRTVVFTNGCFDILHCGHVAYLAAAREAGDLLVVGLNTDRSVAAIKGPRRPVVPERQRAEMLAALACVDVVTLFDETEPCELIRCVRPDVLVKGGDYDEADIVGADIVRAAGGRVLRLPLVAGVSTSAIIDRIVRRYG